MISQVFYFKIIRTFELVKENLSFILSKKFSKKFKLYERNKKQKSVQ